MKECDHHILGVRDDGSAQCCLCGQDIANAGTYPVDDDERSTEAKECQTKISS